MSEGTPESIRNLREQYETLTPLFEYLKARLKYDTVRWIRTVGAKDDIVFSTRVKSFDRIYDKLVRKLGTVPKNVKLIDQIVGGNGLLDDVIGIRFVCFDPHQIVRLVSNFITTERVSIHHPEFYLWPRSDQQAPVYTFLRANGFVPQAKHGREYEDVNFILKFAHPIDKYFQSGATALTALQENSTEPAASSRHATLVEAFDRLRTNWPEWITQIPRFPIECQIATATQHLYNRMQRPLYEQVIQGKDLGSADIYSDVGELERELTLLKINLSAVDHSSRAINDKYGVRYEFIPETGPTIQYGVENRLPPDILGIERQLIELNNVLIAKIIAPDVRTRLKDTKDLRAQIESFNEAVSKRAASHHDILDQHLLDLSDPPDLGPASILFWGYQRIVLLCVCNVLLHSNDAKVNQQVLAFLNDAAADRKDQEPSAIRFGSDALALNRLFERLITYDSIVLTHLTAAPRQAALRNLDRRIFADPLIAWRYATLNYKSREYGLAKDRVELGLKTWDELVVLCRPGEPPPFRLPQRELFVKRRVDYELCLEMERGQQPVGSIPGVIETCQRLAICSEEWFVALDDVRTSVEDSVEQSRAVCLQLLLRLCVVSAQGIDVSNTLKEALGKYGERFEARVAQDQDSVKSRSWWLLCIAAIADDGWQEALARAKVVIDANNKHPREKIAFEELCAALIAMWRVEKVEPSRAFATSLILGLQAEVVAFAAQHGAATAETKALNQLLTEAVKELREHGGILVETKKSWTHRFRDKLVETGEQFVVDAAISGARVVLGF